MSQLYSVQTSGPGTMSQFATPLAQTLNALLSQHSGATRPPYAVAGTTWLQIVSAWEWDLYLYTGSSDILVLTYNPIANTCTLNASALGFPTANVLRSDVSPLAMINARLIASQGVNSEGLLQFLGRASADGDGGGLQFLNGVSGATLCRLLSQLTPQALRLLDNNGNEAIRFETAGNIVSTLFGSLSDRLMPPGSIILAPFNTAPSCAVNANGALLLRSVYARLWAAAQANGKFVSEAAWSAGSYGCFTTGDGATNFRIPDINGYFLRGVRDEATYAIGVYSADAFAQHNHGVSDPTHTHGVTGGVWGGNTYAYSSGSTNTTPIAAYTVAISAASTGIGIQNAGAGSETKPRNVALRAFIVI